MVVDEFEFTIGNEVNDGWKPIVDEAVRRLRSIDPGVEFVQAKQKFADLCLYYTMSDSCELWQKSAASAVVRDAGHRAHYTCERCGAVGRVRRGRRIWVSCSRCETAAGGDISALETVLVERVGSAGSKLAQQSSVAATNEASSAAETIERLDAKHAEQPNVNWVTQGRVRTLERFGDAIDTLELDGSDVSELRGLYEQLQAANVC